jgi:hypothetical protein
MLHIQQIWKNALNQSDDFDGRNLSHVIGYGESICEQAQPIGFHKPLWVGCGLLCSITVRAALFLHKE